MKSLVKQHFALSIVSALMFVGLQSCKIQSMITNEGSKKAAIDSALITRDYEYIIKTDDKLSMSIWDHDDLSIGSVFGIYNSNEVYGKWVMIDKQGEASFPKIGKLKLAGNTVSEATEKLKVGYAKFIIDPIIVVKVLNKEVSVLGEVRNSGKYLLEKDNNTIFEAIAMAGGLDFYSDIKRTKLVRNNIEYQIDLTSTSVATEKNFLILPNDVIYIPTKKGKTIDRKAPDIIPFSSALTAIAIIISMVLK